MKARLGSRREKYTPWSVPGVDQVMAEERAAAFTKRSIKDAAKLEGLKLAVSMMDLTTLQGRETPGKLAFLCRKAMQPWPGRSDIPSCAAVLRLPGDNPCREKISRAILRENCLGRDRFPEWSHFP